MANLIPLSDLVRDRNYNFRSEGIYDPTGNTAYGADGRKMGTVRGAMVEPDTGRLRYLIVDVGGWFTSKEVLVPVGMARMEDDAVYFDNLTKDQVRDLREYRYGEDYGVESQSSDERVFRGSGYGDKAGYSNQQDLIPTDEAQGSSGRVSSDLDQTGTTGIGYNAGSSSTMAGDAAAGGVSGMTDSRRDSLPSEGMRTDSAYLGGTSSSSSSRYNYRDEDTADHLFKSPERLRLLEERLVVDKDRYRAGTVEVSKHVETRPQQVDVNLAHEEVVIERHPVTDPRPVEGGVTLGADRETVRVDLEAERANVQKQAYVTEEVEIGKRAETETRTFSETVGREVLDVNKTGDLDVRGDATGTGSVADPDDSLDRNRSRKR